MESRTKIRFEPIQSRSQLTLEAESSLHPVHVVTHKIEGYFEAMFADGKLDLSAPLTGHIEVYVEDLRSGNNLIDRAIQSQLDERHYPSIKADIVELQAQGSKSYAALGDISFHGVTKRLKEALSIAWLDKATLEIRGETTIDCRDFKVAPPKLLMLTVEPIIKIRLNLIMRNR